MLTRLALIFSVVASGLALSGPHQMRSDLDDSTQSPKSCAEALHVGPSLAQAATLGVEAGAVVYRWGNAGSVP
jgi:hypothetical protein